MDSLIQCVEDKNDMGLGYVACGLSNKSVATGLNLANGKEVMQMGRLGLSPWGKTKERLS